MDEKSKTQLIQQKIKARLQSRKVIEGKEGLSIIRRQASTKQQENSDANGQRDVKIRASMRLRPQTSQKNKYEEAHSLTTDSSNKNEIDINTLIIDVFNSGFELENYLSKKNLNLQQCKNKLLGNGLFITLMTSKLSKVQEDKHELIIEKQIIHKLEKMNVIERQEKNCLMIEQKINNLLNERLKSLSQY